MSDDQRIERRATTSQRGGGARSQSTENRFAEKLDGNEHPELLLPFELFDRLLNGLGSNALLRDNAHTLYDPRIRALGYDLDTFWQELAAVAKPYLDARERKHGRLGSTDFTMSTGKKFWAPISRDLCTARFASLQESRRTLGGKEFDRLLYVVVAPGISEMTSGNLSQADRSEQLRYIAGGCQ